MQTAKAPVGPLGMLLLGQALLVGLAARQAYTLSQGAQLLQSQASPQTAASLTGLVAQQKALTVLVYAGWLMFVVGGGLTIAVTLRRRIRWPTSGAILLAVGHLALLVGLYVLPIVLSSPPQIEELATQFTTQGVGRWMDQQADIQAASAVVAAAGWLFNAVGCGLAWDLTNRRSASGD